MKRFKTIIFSPAFQEAARIRQEKHDYGGIEEYFPFGNKSFIHEIHKKALRLKNLELSGKEPNCESINDNLIDLINYASYYWEHLNGGIHER